jgi:hypothetical protein
MKFPATSGWPQVLIVLMSALPNAVLAADPAFIDRSDSLPVRPVYDGGWEHFVGGGVAIFDCNGDARLDLFVAGGEAPATLLVNVTEGADIAFRPAQIDPMKGVMGAYPIDIDSDAVADLVVLRDGPNRFLKGVGDCTFTNMPTALNLDQGTGWTTAFSATWEAGQGLPTLAFGNYVDKTDPKGPFGTCDMNWLLRPDGDSYASPVPLDPGYCPLSMLFSDWRRDGAAMLRISNDRQYYIKDGYEQMWSMSPLRELDEADGWARLQLWGMGIGSQDLNADGLPEVMLTSMGDQWLMANDGQGFTAAPFDKGATAHRPFVGDDGRPSTGWHAEFGDIDNDGRSDLFITKGNVDQMPGMAMKDPNNLLMQRADGSFAEKADIAGIATTARSRGAGLADLNNDGLLDIVVVNRRAPLEIWQNVTEGTGGWLGVNLQQPAPNTHAIGAFVELRANGTTQTREITVGGGHLSGSLAPAHFGLGLEREAELRVIWPDRTATDWMPVAQNQVLRIEK